MRKRIRSAKEIARRYDKPLILTETGNARGQSYETSLLACQEEQMGWYITFLIIGRNRMTGTHGTVYPDGTIRDPAVVAALLGFFRNRDPDVSRASSGRGGRVPGRGLAEAARQWLGRKDAPWEEGLDLAEKEANFLEARQLVPMFEPPTVNVARLRRGAPDLPQLTAYIREWTEIIER